MAHSDHTPVVIHDLGTAQAVSVSPHDLEEVARESNAAAERAERAIDLALARAEEAENQQSRIHAHNEDCATKFFWGRPSGWRSHEGGGHSYRGYTHVGDAGVPEPHGEGESSHPNVVYRCAVFDAGAVRGLFVERFADGSVTAGFRDDRTGAGDMRSHDVETRCAFTGHWTTVDDWMSLQLGSIEYPDKTVYRGECGRVSRMGRVWPDGYGIWSNPNQGMSVQCRFEGGLAHGAALVSANGKTVGAKFERGQLIAVAV